MDRIEISILLDTLVSTSIALGAAILVILIHEYHDVLLFTMGSMNVDVWRKPIQMSQHEN